MKPFSVACLALFLSSHAIAFQVFPVRTICSKYRMTPCRAMTEDPVHSTENLLHRVTELCDDEACEVEALMNVKSDLSEHCSYIEKQLENYKDENEEFDPLASSGDVVEHMALSKYLEKLRSLHVSVNEKLSDVDARLATAI